MIFPGNGTRLISFPSYSEGRDGAVNPAPAFFTFGPQDFRTRQDIRSLGFFGTKDWIERRKILTKPERPGARSGLPAAPSPRLSKDCAWRSDCGEIRRTRSTDLLPAAWFPG